MQTLQQAQSLFALLVDGHLQGVAVGRHGAQRVARRHHLGSGCGQQAGDLAGAHAGGLLDQLALALRVQQRGGRHRAGETASAIGSSRRRFRRDAKRCAATPMAPRPARAPSTSADAGRCVGGRSCGAGPSSDDGAAGPASGNGNGSAGGRRKRRRRFRSTPAAAAARRHARRRGPAQQRGLPPAPRARSSAAASPAHSPAGGANPGADWGPRSPRRTRFARRCRRPKLPGSVSGIVILILIVAATLTDVPAPGTALALGPLGAGKGGFQLRRRRHTQLAALQAGPHPPMAPAQPHRLDAPLRGGVGEAQLPHRVVEQAREPAPQRQTAAADLVEMVEDVHFNAALIGGQAPGPIEELLIAQLAERSSASHASSCRNYTPG